MGNRIDKLITSSNLDAYVFPFSKVWLALYDKEPSEVTSETQINPHKSHRTLSQCVEHLLETIPIPIDYPQDTFGASIRKDLQNQLLSLKEKQKEVLEGSAVETAEGTSVPTEEVAPGHIRLRSSVYENLTQLFRSIPLITMRVHITSFEVTNEMITECWGYFRQTNKACLQKYGPIANSTPVTLSEQVSKFYHQGSLGCLFSLFVDLDSPEREKEYYAMHFIHPNGYEFHISRIQKHQIEANPHNLCVTTTPSEVNYERGSKLVKILQKAPKPLAYADGTCNSETDHNLFVTIQGTPHESDYALWDLSKGKKSRAEQLPPMDADKCGFYIFYHNQSAVL